MPDLTRGANISLTKEIPDLAGVIVGTQCDTGDAVLRDALTMATVLCDASGKAVSNQHFVYFNQIVSADTSTAMLEDILGDDNEQVEIDLASVPPEVARISFVIYVNEGPAKRHLGQLTTCRIRLLNLAGGTQIIRSENLATALKAETAVILAEVYRYKSDWKFKVIGQGYSAGITEVAAHFGVSL